MRSTDIITTYQAQPDDIEEADFYVHWDVRRNLHIYFVNDTEFEAGEEIEIPTQALQDDIRQEVLQEQKRILKTQQ